MRFTLRIRLFRNHSRRYLSSVLGLRKSSRRKREAVVIRRSIHFQRDPYAYTDSRVNSSQEIHIFMSLSLISFSSQLHFRLVRMPVDANTGRGLSFDETHGIEKMRFVR